MTLSDGGAGREQDGRGDLAAAVAIAGTELLVIDEATTARGFRDQVRFNAAYYRLAQRI